MCKMEDMDKKYKNALFEKKEMEKMYKQEMLKVARLEIEVEE